MNLAQKRLEKLQNSLRLSQTEPDFKAADSNKAKIEVSEVQKISGCDNSNINKRRCTRSSISKSSFYGVNHASSDISNSIPKKALKLDENHTKPSKSSAGNKKIQTKTNEKAERTKCSPAQDRLERLQKRLVVKKSSFSGSTEKQVGLKSDHGLINKISNIIKTNYQTISSQLSDVFKEKENKKAGTGAKYGEGSSTQRNDDFESKIFLTSALNFDRSNIQQKNINNNDQKTTIEYLRMVKPNTRKSFVREENKVEPKNINNTSGTHPNQTSDTEFCVLSDKLQGSYRIPKKRNSEISFQEATTGTATSSAGEPVSKTRRIEAYGECLHVPLQNNKEKSLKLSDKPLVVVTPQTNALRTFKDRKSPVFGTFSNLSDKNANTYTGFSVNSKENLSENVNNVLYKLSPATSKKICTASRADMTTFENSRIDNANVHLEVLPVHTNHKNMVLPKNEEYNFQRPKKNIANERLKRLNEDLKADQNLKELQSKINIKTVITDSSCSMSTKLNEKLPIVKHTIPIVNYEPMDAKQTTKIEDAKTSNDTTYDIVRENLLKLSSKKTPSTLSFTKDKFCIVLDTNILLHKLDCVYDLTKVQIPSMGRPVIVIPYCVLQELDTLKHSKKSVTLLSIKAINYLNAQFEDQSLLVKGQSAIEDQKRLIYIKSADDCIINCCLQIKDASERLILLTYDKNLKNKAISNDIQCCTPDDLTNL